MLMTPNETPLLMKRYRKARNKLRRLHAEQSRQEAAAWEMPESWQKSRHHWLREKRLSAHSMGYI